ncbi:50S ribosomal protein L6 [Mycoplasma marinum]|uniref:Large ribosomal subunit protein uL6 n=1 Tax=Mycoplasma marinum TaxID=1937190 RepID=A0A4R0XKG7_9MOLU|nr:50S ribosomal protein L6 [Mycoplasma marinum]TCG11133.1 50S ribosomal protein L6 [Mycoplasma marinum]
MSRVGNRIINIIEGVEVKINGTKVEIKGAKGTISREFSPLIAIENKDGQITTVRANENKQTKQLHGTTNALINNMIIGVSQGFKKELIIKGVGYKAALKGKELIVNAGYSHPHTVSIPEGLEVVVEKPTEISITGIEKEKVGQLAAIIRDIRRPNPYSGKGIMYKDEIIRRKEGKAAGK